MIFSDSRYVDGILSKPYRKFSNTYEQTVYRTWPSYNVDFFYYTFTEIDRLEELAATYLGSPDLWWRIMDINPNIINPFNIAAGTQIRIPSE